MKLSLISIYNSFKFQTEPSLHAKKGVHSWRLCLFTTSKTCYTPLKDEDFKLKSKYLFYERTLTRNGPTYWAIRSSPIGHCTNSHSLNADFVFDFAFNNTGVRMVIVSQQLVVYSTFRYLPFETETSAENEIIYFFELAWVMYEDEMIESVLLLIARHVV